MAKTRTIAAPPLQGTSSPTARIIEDARRRNAAKRNAAKTATQAHRKRGRRPGNNRNGKTEPGQLTKRGSTSTLANKEAIATATRDARRTRNYALYVEQELTMEQIAALLTREGNPITAKTVCLDIHSCHDELREARLDMVERDRDIETRRTLRNDRAILPHLYGQGIKDRVVTETVGTGPEAKVVTRHIAPDPIKVAAIQHRTHERLTASIETRAKLNGTYAPIKIAPTDPGGQRRYHDLSDEDLDRLIAQKTLLLGAGVIDVTPGRNGSSG